MSGRCRKSPIGHKDLIVTVNPADPAPLEHVTMRVYVNQDRSWRGTLVRVQLTCPGMLTDLDRRLLNNWTSVINNFAAGDLGNFKGTAKATWPNGQQKVVNFFYSVTR